MPDEDGIDYDRVRAVLERAVARACPPRLADRRDDIVQAALLKLLEMQRRGEAGAVPGSSYLWQVAHTVTVDELRRLSRRREVGMDGANGADPIVVPSVPASGAETTIDLRRQIRACLAGLNEARRVAATLHLMGFHSEEAARALGWSVKRVRNATFRGLGDLRRCLSRKGIRP